MALSRGQLPIFEPCRVFAPSPGRSFCDECRQHVHDLSAMTEPAARRFLAAHAHESPCVAYRVRADDTVFFREAARPLAITVAALGLAACTGHAPQLETPSDACVDGDGFVIDCPDGGDRDGLRIPDDGARNSGLEGNEDDSDDDEADRDERDLEADAVLDDAVLDEIEADERRARGIDPADPSREDRSETASAPPLEQLSRIESWCEILTGRLTMPEPEWRAERRHRKERRCVERLTRRKERRERLQARSDERDH